LPSPAGNLPGSVDIDMMPACVPVFFYPDIIITGTAVLFQTTFFTGDSTIFVRRILFWCLFNISVLSVISITQIT